MNKKQIADAIELWDLDLYAEGLSQAEAVDILYSVLFDTIPKDNEALSLILEDELSNRKIE